VEVVGVFLSFIFVTFLVKFSFEGEFAARLEFLIFCSSFRNMAAMVAAVTCGHCQILFVCSLDRILCCIAHLHRIKPCASFFLSLNCCYRGKMMYNVLATFAALVIHPHV
jgi:hypothetical protein